MPIRRRQQKHGPMERPRPASLSLKVAAALKCPAASCERQLLRKKKERVSLFLLSSQQESLPELVHSLAKPNGARHFCVLGSAGFPRNLKVN